VAPSAPPCICAAACLESHSSSISIAYHLPSVATLLRSRWFPGSPLRRTTPSFPRSGSGALTPSPRSPFLGPDPLLHRRSNDRPDSPKTTQPSSTRGDAPAHPVARERAPFASHRRKNLQFRRYSTPSPGSAYEGRSARGEICRDPSAAREADLPLLNRVAGQVPGALTTLGQECRRAAHVLRLPSRALEAPSDVERERLASAVGCVLRTEEIPDGPLWPFTSGPTTAKVKASRSSTLSGARWSELRSPQAFMRAGSRRLLFECGSCFALDENAQTEAGDFDYCGDTQLNTSARRFQCGEPRKA
jgi:hypothetical protein